MRVKRRVLMWALIFYLLALAQSQSPSLQSENLLVTLISQPKFTFSLASDPTYNYWTAWLDFPQLHHWFTLDKDQLVSITKKVMVSYVPYRPKALATRVLIDNEVHPNFNGMTGDVYLHDHSEQHSVFLKKGKHFVTVQYSVNGILPAQIGNQAKQSTFNQLKIVYFSSR